PVDGPARRAEHDLAYAMTARQRQQADGADHVGLDVVGGILVGLLGKRRADQVDDDLDALERGVQRVGVEKVALPELDLIPAGQHGGVGTPAGPLEDAYLVAPVEKEGGEVGPDEAESAEDQDLHEIARAAARTALLYTNRPRRRQGFRPRPSRTR